MDNKVADNFKRRGRGECIKFTVGLENDLLCISEILMEFALADDDDDCSGSHDGDVDPHWITKIEGPQQALTKDEEFFFKVKCSLRKNMWYIHLSWFSLVCFLGTMISHFVYISSYRI